MDKIAEVTLAGFMDELLSIDPYFEKGAGKRLTALKDRITGASSRRVDTGRRGPNGEVIYRATEKGKARAAKLSKSNPAVVHDASIIGKSVDDEGKTIQRASHYGREIDEGGNTVHRASQIGKRVDERGVTLQRKTGPNPSPISRNRNTPTPVTPVSTAAHPTPASVPPHVPTHSVPHPMTSTPHIQPSAPHVPTPHIAPNPGAKAARKIHWGNVGKAGLAVAGTTAVALGGRHLWNKHKAKQQAQEAAQ